MLKFHVGVRPGEVDAFIAHVARLSDGAIVPSYRGDSWEEWSEPRADIEEPFHVVIDTMTPLMLRELIMEVKNFLVPMEGTYQAGICVTVTDADNDESVYHEFTLRVHSPVTPIEI